MRSLLALIAVFALMLTSEVSSGSESATLPEATTETVPSCSSCTARKRSLKTLSDKRRANESLIPPAAADGAVSKPPKSE